MVRMVGKKYTQAKQSFAGCVFKVNFAYKSSFIWNQKYQDKRD